MCPRSSRVAALAALLGPVFACAASEEPSRAETAPSVVTITVTGYAYRAPDTIPAGFMTLRLVNETEQMHIALVAQLDEGRTAQEFVEAYGHAVRTGGPRPTWARWRGGPGAEPHGESSTTQHFEPGDYVVICAITTPEGTSHFEVGMVHEFVVRNGSGDAARQTAPEADLVMRLLDYDFEMSAPLTAGRHVIRVENAGVEPHDVSLLKLESGMTVDDLRAWLRKPEGAPPGRFEAYLAALSSGAEAFLEAEVTPGDYVLLCFVDGPTGVPHHERGMIRHIRVG